MILNIGDKIKPSNNYVKPVYRNINNEYGEDSSNDYYVPFNKIGIIWGVRERYLGTPNEYRQYYISFLNEKISTTNLTNLYDENNIELVK